MRCGNRRCNERHPNKLLPEYEQAFRESFFPIPEIYQKLEGVTQLAPRAGKIALFTLLGGVEPTRIAVVRDLAPAKKNTTLVVRNQVFEHQRSSKRRLQASAWLIGNRNILYTTEATTRPPYKGWRVPHSAPLIEIHEGSKLNLRMGLRSIEPSLAYPRKPSRFFKPDIGHSEMLLELRDTLEQCSNEIALDEEVVHYMPSDQPPATHD